MIVTPTEEAAAHRGSLTAWCATQVRHKKQHCMRCWSSTANGAADGAADGSLPGKSSYACPILLQFRLLASHLPVDMLVVVQDGLAGESAAAKDPVNHPVPDKEFMCLSHIATLPVQPALCGLEVCIACCSQGRHSWTGEMHSAKPTGTRGNDEPHLEEMFVGCPAAGVGTGKRGDS